MPMYNLFGEFQIVGPNLAKRVLKILRNRYLIHNLYKKLNSSARFYLIWRIINFGYKFAPKIV